MFILWVVVVILSVIGLIACCNANEDNGAGFCLAIVMFAFLWAGVLPHQISDHKWKDREIATENVFIPEQEVKTIQKKYAEQRVWSILIRETWQFERGYTLKEAESRRDELLRTKEYQTRLFVELDNALNEKMTEPLTN